MSWFRNPREEYLLGFGFFCELQTSELKVAEKIREIVAVIKRRTPNGTYL